MQALFKRAAQSILGLMGEDALFRGAITKINIERDVKFAGYDDTAMYKGDLTVSYDVATLSGALAPRSQETFQFGKMVDGEFAPDADDPKTYRLEKRIDNNGFNPRWVVIALD